MITKQTEKRQKFVIWKMIKTGIIPKDGLFDITENHLNKFIEFYGNSESLKHKSNYRLARKLAGKTLLNLKIFRGANVKSCKEGFVYLLSNPAWPEFLKVGMAIDSERRLSSYQMYDPLKLYKIKHYEFVFDRKSVEENILKTFNVHIESGEWLRYEDSLKIINCVRNSYYKD